MAGIQASTGIISGLPIEDLVTSMLKNASDARDVVAQRTNALQSEQKAYMELSALLLKVQYVVKNLGKAAVYNRLQATSSDSNALTAKVTGTPPKGAHQFTPLRMVQSQQLLSAGLASKTESLGGGTFSFRFGPHVEQAASLAAVGSGQGFVAGKIRITDRSGSTALIDLSTAQTIDDVIETINSSTSINVTATAVGDHLRLTDNTQETTANLRVQEAGGTTAASLGLDGINLSADSADGRDILRLGDATDLDLLNDGSGVRRNRAMPDIQYSLRDGSTGTIDLSPILSGGSTVDEELRLGDVMDVINEAAPGKLQARIAADGDRLEIVDLTSDTGEFALSAINDSLALADLGLTGASQNGLITGRRLMGGLKTVLLSTLNGGAGFGTLGDLQLTDRSGATATVSLASAETLQDVIERINAAGIGITARVNRARTGIDLMDTTNSTTSHLVVANGDGTSAADKLQIRVDDDVTSVQGGDLHRKIVAENTRLSQINGGKGVGRSSFTIVDSAGVSTKIDLNKSSIETIGDVIAEINRTSMHVQADLNQTGDGIVLRDTAHGSGTLKVNEGMGSTAHDLHLLADATTTDYDGQPTQVIDGSMTYKIELSADDSLEDLSTAIGKLQLGVSATIFNDGSATPFRLVLTGPPGKAGEMTLQTSVPGLQFQEVVSGQDAMLAMGDPGAGAGVTLMTSTSNVFADALAGASLEIKQATGRPVTVTVGTSDTDVVANMKTLVESYNAFRDKLVEDTKFDADSGTAAVLTGDAATLRMDSDLPRLLSGRITGAGSLTSLAELGITFKDDGTLVLDEEKLRTLYAQSPQEVQDFFSKEKTGLSARFDAMLEGMCGAENSLLSERLKAMEDKITDSQKRMDFMDARIKAQEVLLYSRFYAAELAIAKMKDTLSAISSIKAIEPLTSTSSQ